MSFPLYPINPAMPALPYTAYLTSPFCANKGSVNCQDPYSILIYSILTLGKQNPTLKSFTAEEILTAVSINCPSVSWTIEQIIKYLTSAYKRGILTTVGGSELYAVNARMALVNPINIKYFCVGQLYKC